MTALDMVGVDLRPRARTRHADLGEGVGLEAERDV
jgi:hypothetical protein